MYRKPLSVDKLVMSFSDPITCVTLGKHWTEYINGHTRTDTVGILSQVSTYVCMYGTSISVGVTGNVIPIVPITNQTQHELWDV